MNNESFKLRIAGKICDKIIDVLDRRLKSLPRKTEYQTNVCLWVGVDSVTSNIFSSSIEHG